MMKRAPALLPFVLLLLTCAAQAQQGNTVLKLFPGAPTGSCSSVMVAVNSATGDFYDCKSGAWHLVAGGGGAPVTFDLIGSGTNVTATMTVGNGATLTFAAGGIVNASTINGVTVTGTPGIGQFPIATSSSTAVWADPVVSGPDANAAAPTGSPLVTAGWDGTNVRRYKTDSTGILQINQTGGSVTLNTISPLTGGGTVAFGGTLTFACPTCVTTSLTNPMTTLGDIIYGAASGVPTRLGANSTGTNQFLRSVSSGVPVWAQVDYAGVSGTPQLPVTKAAVTSNWLNSYTSGTGLFTATQPTLADIAAGISSAIYAFTGADTASNIDNTIYLDGTKYPVSGSAQNTTGTITSGQPTLTLTSALDFKNGQGIAIVGAGAAPSIAAASAIAVSPCSDPPVACPGATGATTYQYQVILIDQTGAWAAPPAAVSIANGNAALNAAGTIVNRITFTGVNGALAAAVYGRTAGSMNYLGLAWCSANACTFWDSGVVHSTRPTMLPATIPAGAQNGILVTTISSGAGTTTLTLAANAGATATTQLVYHDDSTAIKNAVTDSCALAAGCGTVVFPPGTYYVNQSINSATANRALLFFNTATNLRLTGAGPSSILTTLLPGQTMLEMFSGSGQEVDHLKIVQPAGGHIDTASNTSGSAIRASGASPIRIHDNEVSGGSSEAIWLTGGAFYSWVGPDNYVHGNSHGAFVEDNCGTTNTYSTCAPTASPLGNTYFNNKCVNVGELGNAISSGFAGTGSCYASDSGQADTYVDYHGNYAESSPGLYNFNYSCVRFTNVGHVKFIDNILKQCDYIGIVLTTSGSTTISGVTIADNDIANTGGTGITIGQGTGLANTMDNITISGNLFRFTQQTSIAENSDPATITNLNIVGNNFKGCGWPNSNAYDCIDVVGQHVVVANNNIDGFAAGSNFTKFGIDIGTTSSNVIVLGNDVQRTVGAAINDASNVAIRPTFPIGAGTVAELNLAQSWTAAQSFGAGDILPSAAGATDLGSTALPFGNLWLGTAATNNFKFQPAATAAARVISMPDPLGAVNMPYVIASGTSAMTTAAVAGGACGTTVTTAATGTATTDSIEVARNAAVTSANGGLLQLNSWVTAGNVNFNYCNGGTVSNTPTAMTINWRVIR